MTIRDLRVLIDEINKLKFLGLPINKNVLKFFEQRSKSYNLLYANGINAIELFLILIINFQIIFQIKYLL